MVQPNSHAVAVSPGRNALLILGMHRSGTSSLARVTSLLGASLPQHVMPANRGNETGYWEPERVVALNDRIFDFFGVAWDDPFAAIQLPAAKTFPNRFADEARALIEQEYPDADLFVIKDPRCTLLHEFWVDVLGSLGIRACPVVVARPFEEVADSLLRRDATSAASAALLYVAYGLEAAAACAAGATVVTYRQVLADWQGTTDRLAREQRITWPLTSVQANVEIDAFLRAPTGSPRALHIPDQLLAWTNTVADWFQRAATGHQPELSELDGIRGELVASMDVFAPLLADRKRQLRSVEQQLAEANELVRQTSTMNEETQGDLRRTAAERDAALAERDTALQIHQDTAAQLQQTQATYLEREREYLALGAELTAEQQRRATDESARIEIVRQRDEAMSERDQAVRVQQETEVLLQQTARQRGEALSERDQALRIQQETSVLLQQTAQERDEALSERDQAMRVHQETAALLQQTEASYQALESELAAQEAKVSAMLAERDALQRLYGETDRQLHETEASYQKLDAERERLRHTLLDREWQRDQLAREIDAIHASHSWRATAPLRSAGRLGRRLLGRNGTSRPLPAPPGHGRPATVSPPLSHPVALEPPSAGEPPVLVAFERRAHFGLRNFLMDEFGSATAEDVLLRIDRYQLPVETDTVRAAAQGQSSDTQALAWASAIAAQAPTRTESPSEPDVSIVIPVYNQLPFTLACIEALLTHATRYTFEILIGDDASTDATPHALATPISGVRHLRHEHNLGFVRNCNATAAAARGRHIVLLNNDTQVLPGWLDELIDTLESNPDIGLVGSKLIFPDGRMQECGGIIWRDGSAWNFGRLEDPRRPEFCYLRDTDYVSGASIALPRQLWETMGGFDELFVPAYAEDVDLAFRVRAHGLRTVVQPLSQLLHFEGTSSGTDLGQGAKAYQTGNLQKLHERWRDVLSRHRENADRPDLEKERAVSRRLLFVDLVTPTPNEDAGSLVAFEMMNAFRGNGFKVTFIPADNFAHMGASTRHLQRIGIETIYHPSYSSMERFLSERKDAFDAILLVRFGIGEAHMQQLRRHYPSAKIIFSNCDLHYLREMREAVLSGDPVAITAAQETKVREVDVIARSDVNLVHSEAELELLRQDVPAAPCVLFPLVHDPIENCAPLSARDGICFVGGYRHPPNADGIIWFVERIWPLVMAAAPSHRLYVAGSSMTPEVAALGKHPNVEVVGFVHDLDAFLAQRRATIAPLRFGAGAKGKVAVSLANGVPVVATNVGAEGMQLVPGVHALVADSEESFAAAVLDILVDDQLWQRLSSAGLQYAGDVTSRASARQRVRSILADLGLST